MKNFNKIFVIMLMYGSSFAGTMGPACDATDKEVTMPCALYGWGFNVQALRLKPSYGDDAFLSAFNTTFNEFSQLYPEWGWGFVIGGSYHFELGSDIKVHWYHFGKTTNRTIFADTIVLEDEQILFTEFRPKWDAVNLEVGQLLSFTPKRSMRIHIGGQYTRISHDYYVNTATNLSPDGIHTSFNGFGPRTGIDLYYHFTPHYSVYAKIAGAVFSGKPEYHTVTRGILDIPAITSYNKIQTAAELENKFGGRIKFNLAQGDIDIDVGYMCAQYFNVQIYQTLNSDKHILDFGLHGPFFRINYLGYI